MSNATNRLATGKPRTLGGGRKVWHAKLDGPTSRYRRYRVHFKAPVDPNDRNSAWEWTSRSPEKNTDEAARELFAKTERFLDGVLDHAPVNSRTATTTMDGLCDAMLEYSRAKGLQVRTVEGRESIARAHIRPTVGKVQVARWRSAHSKKVLEAASKTCGAARLSDIRTVMAVMRTVAHDNGWLDASVNPLNGLPEAKTRRHDGAEEGFVHRDLRPETAMVDAMADAAAKLVAEEYQSFARFPMLAVQYRLAGYGGLRLGEQAGLRAWDVYFDRGVVQVNGSWVQPRGTDGPPHRGPVKNNHVHAVPLPASLMGALLPRVKDLLGLPGSASLQQVLNAQRAERVRRGRLTGTDEDWYDVAIDPAEEAWMFVDTTTGLPTRSETHNHYWHKVRRWVEANDPERAWPEHVPYRNMRHHAATFWHDVLGRGWPDVALFLGDELRTVLNHYVLPGASALQETVKALNSW